MSSENQSTSPAVLFRSFLLVAGAYVLNLVGLFAAGLLIAKIFFPDSFAIMNSEPEKFNQVLETQPERVFPPEMLWIVLVVSSSCCFALGYMLARHSPVSKFSHAILFAAVLFAQYLQLAIGAHESLQSMLVLFMGVSPIAALLGANFYLQRMNGKDSA